MGKAEENLYEVLGVSKDADIKEIKKAYRQLSKEHHPDKGGDEELFKKISKAYAVLSDEIKRQKYDAGEDYESIMSLRDEAINKMMPLFQQAIMAQSSLFGFNPTTSNLFDKISGKMRGEVGKLQRDIESTETEIENLKAVRERIKKGEVFQKACTSMIQRSNTQIKRMKHEIKVCEEALEILEGCEYQMDEDTYMLEGAQNG